MFLLFWQSIKRCESEVLARQPAWLEALSCTRVKQLGCGQAEVARLLPQCLHVGRCICQWHCACRISLTHDGRVHMLLLLLQRGHQLHPLPLAARNMPLTQLLPYFLPTHWCYCASAYCCCCFRPLHWTYLQDGYQLYALPAIMPPKGLESARMQIDFGGPTTPAGTTFLVEDITLVKAGVSGAVPFTVSRVNTEHSLRVAQCAVRHLEVCHMPVQHSASCCCPVACGRSSGVALIIGSVLHTPCCQDAPLGHACTVQTSLCLAVSGLAMHALCAWSLTATVLPVWRAMQCISVHHLHVASLVTCGQGIQPRGLTKCTMGGM
jgi:hypothetical protein